MHLHACSPTCTSSSSSVCAPATVVACHHLQRRAVVMCPVMMHQAARCHGAPLRSRVCCCSAHAPPQCSCRKRGNVRLSRALERVTADAQPRKHENTLFYSSQVWGVGDRGRERGTHTHSWQAVRVSASGGACSVGSAPRVESTSHYNGVHGPAHAAVLLF